MNIVSLDEYRQKLVKIKVISSINSFMKVGSIIQCSHGIELKGNKLYHKKQNGKFVSCPICTVIPYGYNAKKEIAFVKSINGCESQIIEYAISSILKINVSHVLEMLDGFDANIHKSYNSNVSDYFVFGEQIRNHIIVKQGELMYE